MIYTIESTTNHIIGHVSAEDAAAVSDAEQFASEVELSELAGNWPAARLVEIWNALPEVAAVKKFKDRATGVSRIWRAIKPAAEQVTQDHATDEQEPEPEIQNAPVYDEPQPSEGVTEPEATPEQPATDASDAEQTPDVGPGEVPATDKPSRAKKSPKVAQNATGSREGSKTATVLALLKREGGATGQELMEATGWQAHSVRGFLSGTLRKKMGIDVLSAKREDGTRFYSIA